MRTTLRNLFAACLLGLLHPALPAVAQDRPHAYFVLIDTSTSMSEVPKRPKVPTDWTRPKMAEVQRQLGEFCAGLPAETEVRIFTFDREFRDGPQVTIAGDSQRDELRKFFATVQPVGNATFAWNSLNRVLGKAAEYAKATPGARVRVLMYTDGEDNDPSKPDVRRILAAYEDLLKEEIQPTIVTLGFTLAKDVTDALTDAGVEHAATFEPQLPLIATLDWEPRQPTTRDEVRFIDCSLGAIVDYAWEFGDGATSSEKAPRHRYKAAGEYVVRLTIRNTKGEKKSTDRKIAIGDVAPLKPSAKAFPTEVRAGEPVQFINESEGSIAAYEWAFGDGETSSEANPRHVYGQPGTFSPTLTVVGTDDERHSIELTEAVRVLPPEPPKVEFTFAPSEATVGDAVQFFDRSTGLIESRAWDFGDGSPPSAERDPQHRFDGAGKFTVKLTCRGTGGEASATASISIAARLAPVARFAVGVTQPRAGDEVVFTDTSSGQVNRATWNFGEPDAAPQLVDYAAAAEDTGRMVRHTFSKAGEYVVTLEVVGPGGTDKTEQHVSVGLGKLPPKAMFTTSATKGREKLTVKFVNKSEGTILQYKWDFGDGSPPLVQNTLEDAEHTFGPGTHTVTLTAVGVEEFTPSRFRETITVVPPPTWFRKNILWITGAVVAAAAIAVFGERERRRRKEFKESEIPTGKLSSKLASPTAPWVELSRATREKREKYMEFDCSAIRAGAPRGRLFNEVDRATGVVAHRIEFLQDGQVVDTFDVEPGKDVPRAGFMFKYEP